MQWVSGVLVLCTLIISGAMGFGCWCTVYGEYFRCNWFRVLGTVYSDYFRCNGFRVLGYCVQLLFRVQWVLGVGVLCTVIISGAIGFGCWGTVYGDYFRCDGFRCWDTVPVFDDYSRCNVFWVSGYCACLL